MSVDAVNNNLSPVVISNGQNGAGLAEKVGQVMKNSFRGGAAGTIIGLGLGLVLAKSGLIQKSPMVLKAYSSVADQAVKIVSSSYFPSKVQSLGSSVVSRLGGPQAMLGLAGMGAGAILGAGRSVYSLFQGK